MFEVGKVYKVKVEFEPGHIGFGRATVLEKTGHHLAINIRSAKENKRVLTRGAKIWFVSDNPDNNFNGLWSSIITGSQLMGGKRVMLCQPPRLEPLIQRRRSPRIQVDTRVDVSTGTGEPLGQNFRTKDLSASGVAIETTNDSFPEEVVVLSHICLTLHAAEQELHIVARVIRIDRNWLANRTTAGLEFIDVAPETQRHIDHYLSLLATAAPKADPAQDSSSSGSRQLSAYAPSGGLAGWMGAAQKPSNRFVKNVGAEPATKAPLDSPGPVPAEDAVDAEFVQIDEDDDAEHTDMELAETLEAEAEAADGASVTEHASATEHTDSTEHTET